MRLGKEHLSEIIRFCIVGVISVLIQMVVYNILLFFLGANVSYSIGYLVSFLTNYFLSTYFTFKVRPSWQGVFGFGASHIINFFLQMGLLNFFIHMKMGERIAVIPVLAISTPVNYILVRFAVTYKKRGR